MLVLYVVICARSFSRHAGNMPSMCVYSEISMVPTNNVALATLKWICWLSKILLWGKLFYCLQLKNFFDTFLVSPRDNFCSKRFKSRSYFHLFSFLLWQKCKWGFSLDKKEKKIHFLMVSANNLELHMEMRKITQEIVCLNSGKLKTKTKSKDQS